MPTMLTGSPAEKIAPIASELGLSAPETSSTRFT
jgi:hypothetical protein